MSEPTAPPYSIGSQTLPGLSWLLEEAGEVVQVVGKILGAGHLGQHWDGSDLGQRLTEQLADLGAAIWFVVAVNGLDDEIHATRWLRKLAAYWKWHNDWFAKDAPSIDKSPAWQWNISDYTGGDR